MRRALLAAVGCALIAGAAVLFAASDRGVALQHALRMRLKPFAAVTMVDVGGSGPLRLFMNPDDRVITPLIEAQGLWEANETHWIQEVLRPGDVFVDVGANIGWYTLIGAREVGPTGRVYAFEPDPEAFALLSRNVRANGLHNVVLENKAVSNEPGRLRLYIAPENKGDHTIYQPAGESRPSVEVEAVALDDYFRDKPKVDCVKVDTEGAELLILKGMRGVIERNESIALVFEYAPFALKGLGGTGPEMLAIFRSLGLSAYDLGTGFGGIRPLVPIDEARLIERYPPDREVFTNLLLFRRRPGLAQAAAAPPPAEVPPVSAEHAADRAIAPGATLALDAATLAPGRPVALRFDLEVASRTDDPRPVRVLATDGRIFEGKARLGAERKEASFELDPAFLKPGRYVVEVKTSEQSHFPLRRYVIEVR